MRIGLVGDLSQQDPALLARALDAALAASDVVVQLGDVNPGYAVVRERVATGKLLVIPGNHDTLGPGNWDAELPSMPKQWRKDFADAILVGLDNSKDAFDDAALALLSGIPAENTLPVFVFAHKALGPIVLPDGTESRHVMGEGGPLPSPAAQQIMYWLKRLDATLACGHYHGQSVMRYPFETVIVEGRGGAAGPGNLGYTVIHTTPDGWVAHPVQL